MLPFRRTCRLSPSVVGLFLWTDGKQKGRRLVPAAFGPPRRKIWFSTRTSSLAHRPPAVVRGGAAMPHSHPGGRGVDKRDGVRTRATESRCSRLDCAPCHQHSSDSFLACCSDAC